MSGSTTATTQIDPSTSGTVINAAVNDSGEVVGTYIDANQVQHGFVDSAGIITTFNTSGAADTDIAGVTNGGQIFGYSFNGGLNGTSNAVGFVGTPTSTSLIVISGTDVEPTADNGFGAVVGTATPNSFLNTGGTTIPITVSGAISTTVTAVNARGEIVGNYVDSAGVQHGFTDLGGSITTIDPAGSQNTAITGLNASNELVGTYADAQNNTVGFTDVNGVFTNITVTPATSTAAAFTVVTGVNNAGTVVGFELGTDGQVHGFTDQNNTITVFDPLGSVNTQPTGINSAGLVVGVFDDANGVEHAFTATVTPACYCPGTMIMTDRGEVAVEALAIGDRVIVAGGGSEPVRWVGRRSYGGRFLQSTPALLPVRVRAGALGDGLPTRDLLVSQAHALLLDGALVPAGGLVNGTTIVRETGVAQVDYLHIELARHDVVLANGALAETFVDDESRGMFHNSAEHAALYPDAVRVPAVYCAPRLVDGFALAALRDRLAGQRAA